MAKAETMHIQAIHYRNTLLDAHADYADRS